MFALACAAVGPELRSLRNADDLSTGGSETIGLAKSSGHATY